MARNPTYKTIDELQEKINEYFEANKGKPVTMTGLALSLGFVSRQAVLNYAVKSAAFNDAITRARLRVEEYAESRLFDRDGAKGAEFTLRCNFGWRTNEPDAAASGMTDAILEAVKKL